MVPNYQTQRSKCDFGSPWFNCSSFTTAIKYKSHTHAILSCGARLSCTNFSFSRPLPALGGKPASILIPASNGATSILNKAHWTKCLLVLICAVKIHSKPPVVFTCEADVQDFGAHQFLVQQREPIILYCIKKEKWLLWMTEKHNIHKYNIFQELLS